jgi:hypothetical protein
MPRFYFDIADGLAVQDDEGLELEGLNAARIEAVRLSGQLLKNSPDRFLSVGEWSCTVLNEDKLVLFVLHFYAAEAPVLGGAKA